MAVIPVVSRAVASAPKDYTVPGAQQIVLRAARAQINGTPTTSSFIPVLQLVSPAGDVMWTASAPEVAAGASADVSWFPWGISDIGGGGSSGTKTFSGARMFRSTNQSIPNNTDTVITFDTLRWDVGGYTNIGTHPTRFTAPQTGYYSIGGSIAFPVGDFYSQIVVLLNSDLVNGQLCGSTTSVPGGNNNLTINTVWKLNAGDFVELDVVQASGAPANCLSAPPQCPEFWISLVGV